MAAVVTHRKVSAKPASSDPSKIGGPDWNDTHVITGLENVDNTSDVNKPVSTAQAAADAVVAANAAAASALKANIASPALTGTPTAPTAATATNTAQLATTAFVQAVVTALINGAPGALDTLKELADAINDDASFAATVTTALAAKAPLASPALTGAPTAPTVAGTTDNTTKLATTAFVQAVAALLAPLASPTFTGILTSPVVKPSSSPTAAWGLDFTGAPQVTVPGSSSVALPTGSGLVMLVDTTVSGQTGLYLIGGSLTASASLISGGSNYVAPTVTPASGKYSIGYDGANWKIYNGNASAITFNVCLMRARSTN